ncbi:MAG: hypothetical protein ACI361_07175 [Atopobiaceae bacterium]
MAKKKRSCEECALSTEKPGFLRSKIVCMAPEGSGADSSEDGRHCPQFVPRMKGLNAVQNLEAMNIWAHKDVKRTQGAEEVTVTETVEAEGGDADLALAAAEAKARAARARAEAAEAEAELAEARLRAAQKRS